MRHCTCSLPCILRSTVALVFIFFPYHLLWKISDSVSAKSPFLLEAGEDLVSMLCVHIKMGSQSHMPANLGAQLHRLENGQKKKKKNYKRKLKTRVCPNFFFFFLQPCLSSLRQFHAAFRVQPDFGSNPQSSIISIFQLSTLIFSVEGASWAKQLHMVFENACAPCARCP